MSKGPSHPAMLQLPVLLQLLQLLSSGPGSTEAVTADHGTAKPSLCAATPSSHYIMDQQTAVACTLDFLTLPAFGIRAVCVRAVHLTRTCPVMCNNTRCFHEHPELADIHMDEVGCVCSETKCQDNLMQSWCAFGCMLPRTSQLDKRLSGQGSPATCQGLHGDSQHNPCSNICCYIWPQLHYLPDMHTVGTAVLLAGIPPQASAVIRLQGSQCAAEADSA